MDLDQFRWKNRLLFLFSPNQNHPLFQKLQKSISNMKPEVEDRDLVVFEILESGLSSANELDIDPKTAQSFREKYDVLPGRFTVVLVGKDGGVKLSRYRDTRLDDIFGLIDSMPMRQQEIRQKDN